MLRLELDAVVAGISGISVLGWYDILHGALAPFKLLSSGGKLT